MLKPRLFAVVVAALALAAIPSVASGSTVARPVTGTAVRAYAGTIVFSSYDQTARRWYLSVREPGRSERRLPVAPSPVPFDADIGPDRNGGAQLIYRRCAGTVSAPTGCDLFVNSLANASGERPVRNANDPKHDDLTPTLWRGRIAWTREYGSGTDTRPVVYTKSLTAPRSQPSTRLPGVPVRRCAEPGIVVPRCGPTTLRRVDALELSGDNLALIAGYRFDGLPGISQYELRLDSVSARTARLVAFLASGMAAPYLVGPSFFGGRLGWYKACGDTHEPACRRAVGPWRYDLATGRYERGTAGPVDVLGFADTGARLYEVVGCYSPESLPFQPPPPACRIDAVTPPRYTAARAPLG